MASFPNSVAIQNNIDNDGTNETRVITTYEHITPGVDYITINLAGTFSGILSEVPKIGNVIFSDVSTSEVRMYRINSINIDGNDFTGTAQYYDSFNPLIVGKTLESEINNVKSYRSDMKIRKDELNKLKT